MCRFVYNGNVKKIRKSEKKKGNPDYGIKFHYCGI